ncbi:MAG: ABC transporter substrate-binding protein [Chloroflexi bacterium]|nr:ABC transporter substrate-binding protein [Chloroflexota bacterium]MCL5076129.1 ABC transporter substrate-binding protein [Chloroflexota bacterium]
MGSGLPRSLLVLVALMFVFAFTAACQPAAPAPTPTSLAAAVPPSPSPTPAKAQQLLFALDWVVYGRHAGYFVALDKGFYTDANLAVNIVRGYGSVDAIKRLSAGKAQFAFGDIGSLVVARANEGVKVKALAVVYGKAAHTLFFYEDTGIKSPKDLEGRTITGGAGDAIMAIFPAFAKVNGIDANKVQWKLVDPATKTPLFLARQAEIITEYLPAKPILEKLSAPKGLKVKSMPYYDYGLPFYGNGLMATESFIKQNPDVTRRFVQATMKGLAYAFDHPDEAIDILRKYHPEVDPETGKAEIAIVKELAMTDEAKKSGLGYMSPAMMKATRDIMTSAFGLKTEVPLDDLYTDEFLSKK